MKPKTIDIHKNNGRGSPGVTPSIISYIKSLLNHPNVEKSLRNVSEQAELIFTANHGDEVKSLELQIGELEEGCKKLVARLRKLEAKEERVKPYKKAPATKGKGNQTPITEWASKHRSSFIISFGLMFIMIGTGVSNVYSNILSSGNPVFLENPHLALFLSALFPASVFATKFIRDFMEADWSRKAFTGFICILFLISTIYWVYQFSIHFPGITNEINLDDLDESGHSDSIMVRAQLLSELFASVMLYFNVSDIWDSYSPSIRIPNPQHIEIVDILKNHVHAHEQLSKELGEKRGRLEQLKAKRQTFINEAVSKFTNQRIRLDNSLLNPELDSN